MELHHEAMKRAKLCLLGDRGVGKTNIVLRFVSDAFQAHSASTLGAAFKSKSIDIDGEMLRFEIWDTAGEERYKAVAPIYYRGAAAAIVVYDITSETSVQCMKRWVKELKQYGPSNIILAVAGNKCDLQEARQVTYDEGKFLADQAKAIFMETSAKTGEGVEDLFIKIGRTLLPGLVTLPKQTLNVGNRQETSKQHGPCCK